MTEVGQFREVYATRGVYDDRVLPHYFDHQHDCDLVTEWLTRHCGQPSGALRVLEFGCGTGRITTCLAPFAGNLVAVDSSTAMIDEIAYQVPQARTMCADTRDAVARLHHEGHAGGFDLVGAFWSLSYPLGAYFETLTAEGVQPTAHPDRARERAARFVRDLTRLLAPDGHLLALLFDSETPEQQLVTRMWERIAPFPEEGRSYTRTLVLGALRDAEHAGCGTLTHTRHGGVAWARSVDVARAWFNTVHFKSLPALVTDPAVQHEIDAFIGRHALPSGEVALPSGVHVIDFHATPHPTGHLPG